MQAFHRRFGPPAEDDLSRALDVVTDASEAERLLDAMLASAPKPVLSDEEVDGLLREALYSLRPHV